MIRKFPGIPGSSLLASAVLIMVLTGVAALQGQQTPQPPQPSDQPQSNDQPQGQEPIGQNSSGQTSSSQSSSQTSLSQDSSSNQEVSPEDIGRERRAKAHNYKNWSFNVGGGASMPNGTTNKFVRAGGGIGDVGVARNYSRYFGFRLDAQFDNLPLRTSSLQAAQAPSATSHAYTANLGPIINIPATKNWGGYLVFGGTYLYRSGKLQSSTAIPGSSCNPFFTWWGHCYNSSLPLNGHFLNESQNEFGYNFGGGITRKIRPNIDFYAEFRYEHGKHNGLTTDFRPITIGIRW